MITMVTYYQYYPIKINKFVIEYVFGYSIYIYHRIYTNIQYLDNVIIGGLTQCRISLLIHIIKKINQNKKKILFLYALNE